MSNEKEVSDYTGPQGLYPEGSSIDKVSAHDKVEEVGPVTAEGVPASHR